ncbi:DMT family transporter [Croceitalea marina]|uniref:DMT family transporter n=1 Tax=Croceitalea marina TaxID=1775166 RepID=A0ABW5MTD1_9FLAO
MSKRTLAFLAALGATTIYAINHTIAKGVMPDHVRPFGFILLRVIGVAALFWSISFLGPKEKIDRKDWGSVLLAALLGMVVNMLAYFKGLELSTPINSSVLMTVSPIVVIVLSALYLKERVTLNKGLGIALGFIGALALVLFGAELRQDAPNIPFGNVLFIVNATAYGGYLIVAKTLLAKYHPFTLMRWLFLIAVVINLPIGLPQVLEIKWSTMPLWAYGTIAFVIICTTFMTYLFNIFAMTQLKASTIGAFIYLQPLFGILFALLTGKDSLTAVKIGAAALVLLGVYLASKKSKSNP